MKQPIIGLGLFSLRSGGRGVRALLLGSQDPGNQAYLWGLRPSSIARFRSSVASVVGIHPFLVQTAGRHIGAGVLTALVIGRLKSTPRLLRGLATGICLGSKHSCPGKEFAAGRTFTAFANAISIGGGSPAGIPSTGSDMTSA